MVSANRTVNENYRKPAKRVKSGRLLSTWDISGECNYRCPYCFNAGNWEKLKEENLIRSVEEWRTFWYGLYQKYAEIEIVISGAEPFTYPNFVEIVREISRFHTVTICTNLSQGIERLVKECDPKRVRLYPAFHPLSADLEKFLDYARLCRKNRFWPFSIVYVTYPPQMADFKKYSRIFRDNGFVLKARVFKTRNDWESHSPSPEGGEDQKHGKSERRYSFEYLSNKISTQGYPCEAGMKYFRINHKGDILKCAQGTIIGSVLGEVLSLQKMLFPCPHQKCPCEYEFSYAHYPTKLIPMELRHFKPRYLLDPNYLFYRLRTINSIPDLKIRVHNLLILLWKIAIGKYNYPLR